MEIKTEVKTVRYIEYDGMRFYEDGKGYWLGQQFDNDGKPHRIRLHIYVWEKHYGPVPDGYEVHHIDKDASNNDIENLIAMPMKEHHQLHMQDRAEETSRYLELYARPKAIEWHKSEEGCEWHKEHYQNSLAPRWGERITLKCEYCGKEYETSSLMRTHSRFCSNNCKAAFRRKSGVDNTERVCTVCGKTYVTNKYSHIKTCSKECGIISQSRTKTAKHHPNS